MQPRQLSNDERRDWLRLSRNENIGAITFCMLIQHFGSAKAAIVLTVLLEMELAGRVQRQAGHKVSLAG